MDLYDTKAHLLITRERLKARGDRGAPGVPGLPDLPPPRTCDVIQPAHSLTALLFYDLFPMRISTTV